MNKQRFKEYLDRHTGKKISIISKGFRLAWHLFQKGDREGYKRGLKVGRKLGYEEGQSHAVYMNPENVK